MEKVVWSPKNRGYDFGSLGDIPSIFLLVDDTFSGRLGFFSKIILRKEINNLEGGVRACEIQSKE